MQKSTSVPRKYGRVAAVLEVEIPLSPQEHWIKLTASIPGRKGTLNRVWAYDSPNCPADVFQDLSTWCQDALLQSLFYQGGLQLDLPL